MTDRTCQLCKDMNKPNIPLQPVFTFELDDINKLNAIFPKGDHLANMFKEGMILDVVYCGYRHGLIKIAPDGKQIKMFE